MYYEDLCVISGVAGHELQKVPFAFIISWQFCETIPRARSFEMTFNAILFLEIDRQQRMYYGCTFENCRRSYVQHKTCTYSCAQLILQPFGLPHTPSVHYRSMIFFSRLKQRVYPISMPVCFTHSRKMLENNTEHSVLCVYFRCVFESRAIFSKRFYAIHISQLK